MRKRTARLLQGSSHRCSPLPDTTDPRPHLAAHLAGEVFRLAIRGGSRQLAVALDAPALSSQGRVFFQHLFQRCWQALLMGIGGRMGKFVRGQASQLGVLQQKELGVRGQGGGGLCVEKAGREEVAAEQLRGRVCGRVQVVEVVERAAGRQPHRVVDDLRFDDPASGQRRRRQAQLGLAAHATVGFAQAAGAAHRSPPAATASSSATACPEAAFPELGVTEQRLGRHVIA